MRKLTFYVLLAYVFTVPWDVVVALPYVGSFSRVAGLVAIAMTAATAVLEGRMRRPDAVLIAGLIFVLWAAASLTWTVSYPITYVRVATYLQLFASLWMVRELARTQEKVELLMLAFCVGAFVPIAGILNNFRTGAVDFEGRFSATGVNPNELALTLVVAMPMAWHFVLRRQGIVRHVAIAFFVLAPLAALLTAARGASVAGAVALLCIPLNISRRQFKPYALGAVLIAISAGVVIRTVPASNWSRMASTKEEVLDGGTMSGRTQIWQAGLEIFPTHPIAGVGAGAYSAAVEPLLNRAAVSHNVPLAILVEGGVIGAAIFVGILAACAWTILRIPRPHRNLWVVVMLAWSVGSLTVNWEYVKSTWLLFGFIAAYSGMLTRRAVIVGTDPIAASAPVPFAVGASDGRALAR